MNNAQINRGGRARHSVRAAERFDRINWNQRRAEDCPPYRRGASWSAPVLPRHAKARQRDGGWRLWLALVLSLCVFNQTSFAADTSADFTAANKLYAEGKFSEASAAYDAILKTGAQSPALLFNAGNAAFKAGHLGKAIAAYRQAEQLAPRDPELRANLAFVRNQVQGATLRESRWQNWVSTLTLNEGAILTAVFFWAMLALFALRQIKPVLAPKLRTATRLAVALAICSGAVLALQAANRFNASIAVVISAEATARSGPFDEAQSVFTARDGAELKVLDRHDDWAQVVNNAGKIGWLSQKQVAVLPGA